MTLHRILGTALILCLSCDSKAGPLSPIALVVHAKRAHLGTATLSPGTTLYEEDNLSTEAGGQLVMRSADATVQVETQTSVILRGIGPTENVSVELLKGILVFSSLRASAVEVRAKEATIRPVADGSTITHIRVVGPNELRIFTRRRAVEFSYGGEREIIAEGLCYRVLLNPIGNDNTPNDDPTTSPQPIPRDTKPQGSRKNFELIAIGAGAALAIWLVVRSLESPDHP